MYNIVLFYDINKKKYIIMNKDFEYHNIDNINKNGLFYVNHYKDINSNKLTNLYGITINKLKNLLVDAKKANNPENEEKRFISDLQQKLQSLLPTSESNGDKKNKYRTEIKIDKVNKEYFVDIENIYIKWILKPHKLKKTIGSSESNEYNKYLNSLRESYSKKLYTLFTEIYYKNKTKNETENKTEQTMINKLIENYHQLTVKPSLPTTDKSKIYEKNFKSVFINYYNNSIEKKIEEYRLRRTDEPGYYTNIMKNNTELNTKLKKIIKSKVDELIGLDTDTYNKISSYIKANLEGDLKYKDIKSNDINNRLNVWVVGLDIELENYNNKTEDELVSNIITRKINNSSEIISDKGVCNFVDDEYTKMKYKGEYVLYDFLNWGLQKLSETKTEGPTDTKQNTDEKDNILREISEKLKLTNSNNGNDNITNNTNKTISIDDIQNFFGLSNTSDKSTNGSNTEITSSIFTDNTQLTNIKDIVKQFYNDKEELKTLKEINTILEDIDSESTDDKQKEDIIIKINDLTLEYAGKKIKKIIQSIHTSFTKEIVSFIKEESIKEQANKNLNIKVDPNSIPGENNIKGN